jgi:hypothetical protein
MLAHLNVPMVFRRMMNNRVLKVQLSTPWITTNLTTLDTSLPLFFHKAVLPEGPPGPDRDVFTDAN